MEPRSQLKTELVDRVKAILRGKGLTLYQCSQRTRSLYGRSPPYFVPHNLYYDLGVGTFSPSLHQFFALSNVSGNKFTDWPRVFGFNAEDISRLQVWLPSKRTSKVDSSLADPEDWVPWLRNKTGSKRAPAVAPLGRLLELAPSRRIRSVARPHKRDFVYVKVGQEDALAFPELLPGSIVRADTRIAQVAPSNGRTVSKPLFLIQHSHGFTVAACKPLPTTA